MNHIEFKDSFFDGGQGVTLEPQSFKLQEEKKETGNINIWIGKEPHFDWSWTTSTPRKGKQRLTTCKQCAGLTHYHHCFV